MKQLVIALALVCSLWVESNAAEAKAVEGHLLACPQCLGFRDHWEQLDQELIRMATPGLSPGFERRLWLRISEMPPPRLEADQKQSVEAELRKDWDRSFKAISNAFILAS